MRKLILGTIIALIVAASGYYGFTLWAPRYAEQEVDAVLDGWRASVGSAARGPIEFNPWTGTLNVRDIVLQSNSASATLKIARLVARGIDRPARAKRIEIADLDFSAKGTNVRIEGVKIDDFDGSSSKSSVTDIVALLLSASTPGISPSPAQQQALADKVARLWDGVRMGSFEMLGMDLRAPGTTTKLVSLRINGLHNGILGEFAIEGLDSKASPNEPVSIGRFALKGLDVPKLLRNSAQLGLQVRPPTPEQLAGLLMLLEGIEIGGFVAPDKRPGTFISVEKFVASWGNFVGTVPTTLRISAKFSGPISPTDRDPFKVLAQSGFSTVAVAFDIGAAWTEATGVLALAPATLEIGNLLSVSAQASIRSVPRSIFTTDPEKITRAAQLLEAGPIEFSVRDLGGLDLWIIEMARVHGHTGPLARAMVIENIGSRARALSQSNPEMLPLVGVAMRMLHGEGDSLSIKLEPKGRVGFTQLIEGARSDLFPALSSRFAVQASLGR